MFPCGFSRKTRARFAGAETATCGLIGRRTDSETIGKAYAYGGTGMSFTAVLERVRRAAHMSSVLGVLAGLTTCAKLDAANVTLAWDPPSPSSGVAGYNLYYGAASRTYTNALRTAVTSTSLTITNLVPGVTYFFAATTTDDIGLESEYSEEASYTVPTAGLNAPPTLDPLLDLAIDEDSGPRLVSLTGITSGSLSETQRLTVAAFSSKPDLIPNPVVNYTNPARTGSLLLKPVFRAFGWTTITVMVDDGGAVSNAIIRTFAVLVREVNNTPTLDPLTNITVEANSGTHTVPLTGIGAGATNEVQTLTVTATSSNPTLIPNPTVNYTSPQSTGTLSFSPVAKGFGAAIVSVTVSDGQETNGTVSQSFVVIVTQNVAIDDLYTNVTVAPNNFFRCALVPPFTNSDRIRFNLPVDSPEGTRISTRKGVSYFSWAPSSAQASTTNLISVSLTDNTTPSLNTNLYLRITVLDYLSVIPAPAAVMAGQTTTIPLYVYSSDGVTNLTFGLSWPSNLFRNPSIASAESARYSASLQSQGTNLQIRLQALPGKTMEGSNLVAQLSFQASASQPSAFVRVATWSISGAKPNGEPYVDCVPRLGQVAVVKDVPLLESTLFGSSGRRLMLYGRVATKYRIEFSTNTFSHPVWYPLTTYSHTNVFQPLDVSAASPLIFYRLQEQNN